MTTYPEIMEVLEEIACGEMYNRISSIVSKMEKESYEEYKRTTNFLENDFYNLKKCFPVPDEQGAYKYCDLVNFVLKFKETWYKIYEDQMKESWGNIYRLPTDENE